MNGVNGIVSIQLTAFCNKQIEPTPAKIIELMSRINETSEMMFLPSVMPVQNISASTNQFVSALNIAFVTTDQRGKIVYMDDRIDVYLYAVTEKFLNFDEDLARAETLFKVLMENDSIVSSRLAINIQCISGEDLDDIPQYIADRYTVFPFYADSDLNDWFNRFGKRIKLKVGDTTEALNVITDLSLAQRQDTIKRRVMCHVDINSNQENKTYRFSTESVSPFLSAVKPVAIEIINSFGRVDKLDQLS